MRPIRYFLVVVVGLMLLAPVALASGTSAGDQQYTDPLGGSNGSSGGSGNSSNSGSNSTAPASAPTTAAAPSASPSPTATAATSASVTTAAPSSAATGTAASGALPRTGFNAWLGAAFGVVLMGAGLAVRRQVHRE
jgi:LPXTG-motif cell wall-anchored protein